MVFKLTFLIKAYNLIVIDSAIDFILQLFDRSNPFFTIISNALSRVPIDTWRISIHYTFTELKGMDGSLNQDSCNFIK